MEESAEIEFVSGPQSDSADQQLSVVESGCDDSSCRPLMRLPPRVHRGLMEKMAMGFIKNWRVRLFILDKGILTYFEPVHLYMQGLFDLRTYEIVENYPRDAPATIRLQSMSKPDICLRPEMHSRAEWVNAIKEHLAYVNNPSPNVASVSPAQHTASSLADQTAMFSNSSIWPGEHRLSTSSIVPHSCEGWLRKKGQLYPSIRRRFFVLSAGILSYYACDITELLAVGAKRLPRPKGKFPIFDYELYSDNSQGTIELYLLPGKRSLSKRRMTIYCDDFMIKNKWVAAISVHIVYRSANS